MLSKHLKLYLGVPQQQNVILLQCLIDNILPVDKTTVFRVQISYNVIFVLVTYANMLG